MDVRGRLPGVLLVAGSVTAAAAAPGLLATGDYGKELPWLLAMMMFAGLAGLTWVRLPEHPAARWFAMAAGFSAAVQGLDGFVLRLVEAPGDGRQLAWLMLADQLGIVAAVVSMAHLFALFPDGVPRDGIERRVLRGLWAFAVVPPLLLLTSPTVVLPTYLTGSAVPNPYAVATPAWLGTTAVAAVTLAQAVFVVGVVLLARRYRRAGTAARRRIRWLLLPGVLAAFTAGVDLLLAGPVLLLTVLWVSTLITLPLSITVALLRPTLLDVDVVLRTSLVYGALWVLIAAVYVAAAAALGVAAGQRFSVGVALTLTVAATLLFQPARRRLEQLADRWVFGERTDAARVVARLGDTLAQVMDLDMLLPQMAHTLQQGLDLTWARVEVAPASQDAPALSAVAGPWEVWERPAFTVPIVLGEERLGTVACGPKRSGRSSESDVALVTTLAHQAALAVRNVKLSSELAERAAQLERSRNRLVRAQQAERRRIERDIHDGAQQDLIALIAQAGRVRRMVERGAPDSVRAVEDLQVGLERMVRDLRDLAHGIHPSVLSDRGLLEAVEALAERSAMPVTVRAPAALRGRRFAEDIEGAGYFTVAEALANSVKHARAPQVEVLLDDSGDALVVEVRDDGVGFDTVHHGGEGLSNLAERVAAIGGVLHVTSRPGHGTVVRAELRTRPEVAVHG